MKKKVFWIVAVFAAILSLATLLVPGILRNAARQTAPAGNYSYSESFCENYEETRIQLQRLAAELDTEIFSHAIDESDGLYIDSFYIPGTQKHTNLVILTTGVHGVEGYIGVAMLDVFFKEVYPDLNPTDTGILVVANVNPYGMKHFRRYNENNVDLNRNFILDWETFDRSCNKDYPLVNTFLSPAGKIGNALWHEVGFYLNLGKTAISDGADTISNALLAGQYEYPQGVYYGGNGDEASTAYLKSVFSHCLDSNYENIVHIDIHSGYGPRYNMSIFNSIHETLNEADSKEAFGYEHVIAYDSASFYATIGDTTDYFYRLAEQKQSDVNLFSSCFEFGTLGDTFRNTIQSLKYTIDENRNHWYPTDNKTSSEIVHQNYMELYYPTEIEWREKAVADFKKAASGILNAKLN